MSVVVDDRKSYEMTLSHIDVNRTREAALRLCTRTPGRPDDPAWVDAARQTWQELPISLRRRVAAFRRDPGPYGLLLLRGLPVGAETLPPTPTVRGSVQREPSIAAAVLLMTACGLGDPGAFRPEKGGTLVQDVVPVPGMEHVQGNVGSTLLTFHNENAFHPHRPDFVMLLCLRADPAGLAGLRVSCIRTVYPFLSEDTRRALFSPEFRTEAPPSFGSGAGEAPNHSVLSGDPADPDLRVDLAATRGTTQRAAEALLVLQEQFDQTAATISLAPGEMAMVDNRITVHGRTAFRPRYDGTDRWLQRTFVLADLRRSRGLRPHDGYVLGVDTK